MTYKEDEISVIAAFQSAVSFSITAAENPNPVKIVEVASFYTR